MENQKLKELLQQSKELDEKIAIARQAEMATALAEVREKVIEFGITPAQLYSAYVCRTMGLDSDGAINVALKSKQPLPIRYRNQTTGDSWSGRGRKPKWVLEVEELGISLEEYRVPETAATTTESTTKTESATSQA